MLGRENNNQIFIENDQMQYRINASNQLQLFGNSVPVGCNVDPANYLGNDQNAPMLRPNKRGREGENISRQRQKLQNSMSYNISHDINKKYVSTGLKLSYDDDERNSSVTSSSGGFIATPPVIMPLGDNMRTELDWQREELDHYIKTQEQVLAKGMMEITQRQTACFISAVEKSVNKKLQAKDLEIENIKRKNMELASKIQKATIDAQWWHDKAKQNESKIIILKNHLQNAISHGADHEREGYGDNETDDAVSYIDPNGTYKKDNLKKGIFCKVCKFKEASILLMPCRHLCLCEVCDKQMLICPVCHVGKTTSVQVYFPE